MTSADSRSTGPDEPRRRYSEAEEAAFRACGLNPKYGPAQVGTAGIAYLDGYAERLERLLPQLRVAVAALRREIAMEVAS